MPTSDVATSIAMLSGDGCAAEDTCCRWIGEELSKFPRRCRKYCSEGERRQIEKETSQSQKPERTLSKLKDERISKGRKIWHR